MNNTEIITIYGLLVERTKHEGRLFWVRFSSLLAISSLLFAVWRFSLSLPADSFFGDPFYSDFLMYFGLITSFCWFMVALDGAKWQEYFNKYIINLERENPFLPQLYSSMYHNKIIPDVLCVGIFVSFLAFIGWIVIIAHTRPLYGAIGLLLCLLALASARIVQFLLTKSTRGLARQDRSTG